MLQRRRSISNSLKLGAAASLIALLAALPPSALAQNAPSPTTGQGQQGGLRCREFTDVEVKEGKVEILNRRNPNAPPVELKAGQKGRVPCAGLIIVGGAVAGLPWLGIVGAGVGAAGAGAGIAAGVGGFGSNSPSQ